MKDYSEIKNWNKFNTQISVHRQQEIQNLLKLHNITSEEVLQALDLHDDPLEVFTEQELLDSLHPESMRGYCDRTDPQNIEDILDKLITDEGLQQIVLELRQFSPDEEVLKIFQSLETLFAKRNIEETEARKRQEDIYARLEALKEPKKKRKTKVLTVSK